MSNAIRTSMDWLAEGEPGIVRALLTNRYDETLTRAKILGFGWEVFHLDSPEPHVAVARRENIPPQDFIFDPPRNGPEWTEGPVGYNFSLELVEGTDYLIEPATKLYPGGGERMLVVVTVNVREGQEEYVRPVRAIFQIKAS